MAALVGKYEHYSGHPYDIDAYLKRLGVGLPLRRVRFLNFHVFRRNKKTGEKQALASSRPTLEVSFSPESKEWTITTESRLHRAISQFQNGEFFEETTFDGRSCMVKMLLIRHLECLLSFLNYCLQSVATIESDRKIVIGQSCDEGPSVTVILQKTDEDNLTVSITAQMERDEAVLIQTFRKIQPAYHLYGLE
jgi:hypothetical protein